MKKIIFMILTISGISFSKYSMLAQTWCAPNSVWDYGWSGSEGGTHTKLTYLYDTLISGNNCNKIFYDELTCGMGWGAESTGNLYTYTQNGVTYIKRFTGNQFDTLFYFTGPIGTKWRRSPASSADCSLSYIEITDTGHVVIQGKSIKWQQIYYENHYPVFPSGSGIEGGVDTLFERLGSKINSSFIIGTHCTNEPIQDKLRCFSDADLNLTFSSEACNYCGMAVGIPEIKKNSLIIFPNPVETMLNITREENEFENARIIISNSIGQEIYNFPYNNTIDVSMLPTGYYFFKIILNQRMFYSGFSKI